MKNLFIFLFFLFFGIYFLKIRMYGIAVIDFLNAGMNLERIFSEKE